MVYTGPVVILQAPYPVLVYAWEWIHVEGAVEVSGEGFTTLQAKMTPVLVRLELYTDIPWLRLNQ